MTHSTHAAHKVVCATPAAYSSSLSQARKGGPLESSGAAVTSALIAAALPVVIQSLRDACRNDVGVAAQCRSRAVARTALLLRD